MTKYESDPDSYANPIGRGLIKREDFFASPKQHLDTTHVHEVHVYPNRAVVYRINRDDNDRIITSGNGPTRTVETYWLN